jgi:hypothetical protein
MQRLNTDGAGRPDARQTDRPDSDRPDLRSTDPTVPGQQAVRPADPTVSRDTPPDRPVDATVSRDTPPDEEPIGTPASQAVGHEPAAAALPAPGGGTSMGVAEVPTPNRTSAEAADASGQPRPDREPGPGPVAEPGGEHVLDPTVTARYEGRWRELQASFVDDPALAVRTADELLSEVVSTLSAAVSDRQRALAEHRDAPQGAATEDLRSDLMRYRGVFERLIHV